MATVAALLFVAASFALVSWILHRPDPVVQVDPPPHRYDGTFLTLRGVCHVCGEAVEHPIHRRTV